MEEDEHRPVPETHGLQFGREALVKMTECGGVEVGVVERVKNTPQMPAGETGL